MIYGIFVALLATAVFGEAELSVFGGMRRRLQMMLPPCTQGQNIGVQVGTGMNQGTSIAVGSGTGINHGQDNQSTWNWTPTQMGRRLQQMIPGWTCNPQMQNMQNFNIGVGSGINTVTGQSTAVGQGTGFNGVGAQTNQNVWNMPFQQQPMYQNPMMYQQQAMMGQQMMYPQQQMMGRRRAEKRRLESNQEN